MTPVQVAIEDSQLNKAELHKAMQQPAEIYAPTEETRDANRDIRLNRYSLDTEAEQQAMLSAYWGAQLADAKKVRDYIATELKCLRGEKYGLLKNSAVKYTADQITAELDCNKEVVAKTNELADAEHLVSMLYATTNALDQKKSMIDTLAKLYLSNYYTKQTMGSEPTQSNRFNQQLNQKG